MTGKKAVAKAEPKTVVVDDPEDRRGRLKSIGGSQSDHWNNILANQAVQALWVKNSSPEERDKQLSATVAALIGIAPKDELEGMMAAQLIAAHNAAMECYRRAMIGEQTFEGRRENLVQAGGGEVAGIVTLVNRSRSGVKPAAKQHVRLIEERYGDIVRQEFGIEPAALTGDEALVVLASRDADTLRDRVAKARQERSGRLREKGIRPLETEQAESGLEGFPQLKIGPEAQARLEAKLRSIVRKYVGDVPVELSPTPMKTKECKPAWPFLLAIASTRGSRAMSRSCGSHRCSPSR